MTTVRRALFISGPVVGLVKYSVLIGLTLAHISCAKKREKHFPQGAGSGLEEIASYQGKEFSLTTLHERLGSGSPSALKGALSLNKKEIPVTPRANITKANRLKISENAHQKVNFIDIVEFKSDAELLNADYPLRARPNTQNAYKVRYEVSKNYLKVYLVGDSKDIPMQDQAYAKPVESGKLAVPLLGYKVLGMFRIEVKKTEANKESSELLEIAESDVSKATHFKIDFASRESFSKIKKLDVFPSDLFGTTDEKNNEWYFAQTIVNTQEGRLIKNSEGFVGSEIAIESAARLKFLKTADGLRAVNVNVDQRVADQDALNLDPVLSIPVTWQDFQAIPNGVEDSLKEEVTDLRPWQDRGYMEIDFQAMKKLMGGAKASESPKLADLEIAPNYISFTLEDSGEGIRTKYAFLRAEVRKYQPKQAFFSDMKTFGFFTQTKSFIDNYETHRQGDYEKNLVVQRFNPATKKIVFHFTVNSSLSLRQVGQDAVNFWNEGFKKAGTGISIELGKHDVQLGDLRYNKINLIETVSDGGGLLGYGPSIADPRTGEIISATANIYVNPVRGQIVNAIRRHVLKEIGALEGKNLMLAEPKVAAVNSPIESPNAPRLSADVSAFVAVSPKPSSSYSGSASIIISASSPQAFALNYPKFHQLNLSIPRHIPSHVPRDFSLGVETALLAAPTDLASSLAISLASTLARILMADESELINRLQNTESAVERLKIVKEAIQKMPEEMRAFNGLDKSLLHGHGMMCMTAMTETDIEAELATVSPGCMTDLKKYIEVLRASSTLVVEGELDLLKTCSDGLLAKRTLPTLMHEMGHNFGLRHNFRASADASNFGTTNDRSSSVMEYSADGDDRRVEAGPYDIAAIRFGYTDQVEVTGQSHLIQIDNRSSIENALGKNHLKIKHFEFCTDEDVYFGMDPLCKRFDSGATPLEVVDFLIGEFQSAYQYNYFSYGRYLKWAQSAASGGRAANATLSQMKEIYDFWRNRLAKSLTANRIDPYLGDLSKEDFEKVILTLKKKDPSFAAFSELYRPAADRAFEFLRNVAQLPDAYCLTSPLDKKKGSPLSIVELSSLRSDIHSTDTSVSIVSCRDQKVVELLKSSGQEVKGQIGFPVQSVRNKKFDSSKEIQIFADAIVIVPDVIGLVTDRLMAAFVLQYRNFRSVLNAENGIYPNFLDEPSYRETIESDLVARVIQGVDLSRFVQSDLAVPPVLSHRFTRFPRFKEERQLLTQQFSLFLKGVFDVPNAAIVPSAFAPFLVTSVSRSEPDAFKKLSGLGQLMRVRDGFVGPESDSSKTVISFFNKMNELNALSVEPPVKQIKEGFIKLIKLGQNKDTLLMELFQGLAPVQTLITLADKDALQKMVAIDPKFVMILGIFEAIEKSVGPITTQEEQKKALNTKISELPGGSLVFPAEFIFNFDQILAPWSEPALVQFNQFQANQAEYSAQTDLLRSIIGAAYEVRMGGK